MAYGDADVGSDLPTDRRAHGAANPTAEPAPVAAAKPAPDAIAIGRAVASTDRHAKSSTVAVADSAAKLRAESTAEPASHAAADIAPDAPALADANVDSNLSTDRRAFVSADSIAELSPYVCTFTPALRCPIVRAFSLADSVSDQLD